ncbi:MAG: hypothetical protein R3B84_20310 [Zavarzinella sp.]
MDQNTLLQGLLAILELVKNRTDHYIGPVEPEHARNFLSAFSLAAGYALGWDEECRFEVREYCAVNRGWKWRSAGPEHQMAAKGWPAEKIVTELIELECDYIRQMTKRSKQNDIR